MEKSAYHRLDDSIESFVLIKQLSEKYWESVELEECWGFQIQEGSKWKDGLSEKELKEFEIQTGFQFPKPLKNFFRTMNGLDKPGLNNNGNHGEIKYGPTFYSFPEDIERIKSQITWILEGNKVSEKELISGTTPPIIPYLGHRFLICDKNQNVLSMHGDDIIFWAANLSQGVAKDIFPTHSQAPTKYPEDSFWNQKAT